MDFNQLDSKKELAKKLKEKYHNVVGRFLKKYEANFALRFSHESTVIEGNTCTFSEAQKILSGVYRYNVEDVQRRREVYEIKNHAATFDFAKKQLGKGELLDEQMIKEFHCQLTENIMRGGLYRTENVGVGGSVFEFPKWQDVPFKMKDFCEVLEQREITCGMPEALHPIELAAWAHEEFVSIHPYRDGNGRTARMVMNYILMQHSYLPISVPAQKDSMEQYFSLLENYHGDHDIQPFTKFIAGLEEKELGNVLELETIKIQQSLKDRTQEPGIA